MTDLDKLIDAVEAVGDGGNTAAIINNRIARIYHDKGGYWPANDVMKAYDGSLDAAKALHEALLPGWIGCADTSGFCFMYEDEKEWNESSAIVPGNPARAWLIAILKAHKTQQEALQ